MFFYKVFLLLCSKVKIRFKHIIKTSKELMHMIEILVGENQHQLSIKQLKDLFLGLTTAGTRVKRDLQDISDEIALLNNLDYLKLRILISLELLKLDLSEKELFNITFNLIILNDEIKKLDVSAIKQNNLIINLSQEFRALKELKIYFKFIYFIIKQSKKHHYDPQYIILLYYFRKDIVLQLKQKKSIFEKFKQDSKIESDEDMVMILLKLGYKLDEALEIVASESGKNFSLIANQLIKAGSNPNIALLKVIVRGDLQFLKLLSNFKLDYNNKDKHGDTLLSLAVERGDAISTCLLIDNGADINLANNDQETPLIKACKRDDSVIAALLINKGANLNLVDSRGGTALLYAIEKADKVLISILLEYKADYQSISLYYKQGMREKRIAYIKLLIELNHLTKEDYLVILTKNILDQDMHEQYIKEYNIAKENLATKNNYHGIVTPASEETSEAKINEQKQAKFIISLIKNDIAAIKTQITDNDISLSITNVGDLQHSDLMHIVSYYGHLEIAKLFLTKNISIDLPDSEGNTPIFLAVINNNLALFRMLLEDGANIHYANNHGISTFDYIKVQDLTEYYNLIK